MAGSNEYQQNIERLAKGVKIKGPLGPVGTREPIRGKVTPFSDDTFAPPSTAPAQYVEPACNPRDGEDGEGETENDNTDPQEPINPADPNTFVRGTAADGQTTEQGTADIGDAIDGNAGPQMPTTGGGITGQGGIRELTGLKDCDSGKEFNLHLDGNFVPPEGWDDPDTPPQDPEFEQGFYWSTNTQSFSGFGISISSPGQSFATKSEAVAYKTTYLQALADAAVASSETIESGRVRVVLDTETAWQANAEYFQFLNWIFIQGSGATRQSCSEAPNSICNQPPPTAESWPADGKYDLAIKDGQLQTNEYDADAPEGFEAGGTKDFCYGDGKTGRAEVTADGGLVYYQTDANGAPIGTARVIDSGGQFVAAGDATDSFISQYLPQ